MAADERGQAKLAVAIIAVVVFLVIALLAAIVLGGIGLVLFTGSGEGGDTADNRPTPTPSATPSVAGSAASPTTSMPVSASPTLSPTESPTPSPKPTPTATPAPTPAPDGQSYSFSGDGGDVSGAFETSGGLVTFDLEHSGSENFAVWLVSSEGEREELLANVIGEYDGTYGVYLPAGEYQLDVDADGAWSADVAQPRYSVAELEPLPDEVSGSDSAVLGPYQFEDTTEITVDADGDAAVSVWVARHDGQLVDLLTNDVAPYEETTLITDSGTGLIFIQTGGGEWTVEIGGG